MFEEAENQEADDELNALSPSSGPALAVSIQSFYFLLIVGLHISIIQGR